MSHHFVVLTFNTDWCSLASSYEFGCPPSAREFHYSDSYAQNFDGPLAVYPHEAVHPYGGISTENAI